MAENLKKVQTTKQSTAQDTSALDKICEMLEAGKSREEILASFGGGIPGLEPLNAGIIRTRKGALMVRVSDDRWPIAMYKRDWQILLSKVDAIRQALDELDIADENPEPTAKQAALQATPIARTA